MSRQAGAKPGRSPRGRRRRGFACPRVPRRGLERPSRPQVPRGPGGEPFGAEAPQRWRSPEESTTEPPMGCEPAGRALGGGRVPGRLAHPMTCATWARGPLGGGASGVSAGPPLRSFSSTRGRSRRAAGGSLAARTRAGLGGAPLGSGPPPGAGQRGKRATSPEALPRQRRLAQCRRKRDSPNRWANAGTSATRPMPAKRRRNARPNAGEMPRGGKGYLGHRLGCRHQAAGGGQGGPWRLARRRRRAGCSDEVVSGQP